MRSGDAVDVWFRGFWWRAHIAAVNLRTGTATISFDHTPLLRTMLLATASASFVRACLLRSLLFCKLHVVVVIVVTNDAGYAVANAVRIVVSSVVTNENQLR